MKTLSKISAGNLPVQQKTDMLYFSAIIVVIATGMIAGSARVELASPFTARQSAVEVTFYDGETGQVINPSASQILPLALQGRLGYLAEIYRLPPNYLKSVLQSVLAWLSLWLALGLTILVLKRSLGGYDWFKVGSIAGWLMFWRLLQAVSVSCWLWLPNWRSDLVVGLLDLVQGHPVPADTVWAVLWRGALWLVMGIATFVHIFSVLRRGFNCTRLTSLLGLLMTYLLARLIYSLSTLQFWQ